MSSGELLISDARLNGRRVDLRLADGRIAEVAGQIEPPEGTERLDARGMAVVPALVNGHTHAAMTLFRGYADDLPLMEWLGDHIWPAEARLEPDDVYWGTRLACLEMIRSGTAGFWDMYWEPAANAAAVADAGLRATLGTPLIDGGDPARSGEVAEAAEVGLEALSGAGELISVALTPHAIYTVSPDSLRWVAERSEQQGLPIHIHLSETATEVEQCLERYRVRPAFHLDNCGALGPRTLLAHGVHLDDAELDLIAERGATIATNPCANQKLAVGGSFDYPAAAARGIPVALGTDGAGSNNSLDLLREVKHLALGQKALAGDASVLGAAEALEVAGGRRAPLLGYGSVIEAGAPADLLLIDRDCPELALGSLDAGLVYAADGSVVNTTIVAGRVLMEDRVVEGSEEIIEQARCQAERLGVA